MLYTIARKVWDIVRWIWLTLIGAFIIAVSANLAAVQTTGLSKTVLVSVLHWFALLELIQALILSVFALFFGMTLFSLVIITKEKLRSRRKSLQKYLEGVIKDNEEISPAGSAQLSHSIVSVHLKIDPIFIRLNSIPDSPTYQLPHKQQEMLALREELRHRPDLTLTEAEREGLIERLKVGWESQLRHSPAGVRQEENVPLEQVLQKLTTSRPAAVILGIPGSGKSTAMRWLALQMARAFLDRPHSLSDDLPRQIPILIPISDYAKYLRSGGHQFPIQSFPTSHFSSKHPQLPNRLLNELERGHCLVLFDGLDEITDEKLYKEVARNIRDFISTYSAEKSAGKPYNRFIITSRIAGYERSTFNEYRHYTLLDLNDEQIQQFLTKWCPAVERYLMELEQKDGSPLSHQQERQADALGKQQSNRLWEAFRRNPNVKRLAVNPLMLTILALIQHTRETLPHRRIELYEEATLLLLRNWNRGPERRVFSEEEIPLVEKILGELAYRMHSSDVVLTREKVQSIIHETKARVRNRSLKKITDTELLRTLCLSGLIGTTGQDLFKFLHGTFQEYYVARYLCCQPLDSLKEFAKTHFSRAIWREPLLLAIAYKSGRLEQAEQEEASEVIRTIATAGNDYDAILHRGLLLAATSMIDCRVWSVNEKYQQQIANRLFSVYGDTLGKGRYTPLQQEIEKITLDWLRGHPQESTPYPKLPPLLAACYTALCNDNEKVTQQVGEIRQEGAIHLLAAIAPDLPSCPRAVSLALIPPLIQLTGLQDLPYPEEMSTKIRQAKAKPASPLVEDYAFIALRMLDVLGPASWLHTAWVKWNQEQLQRSKRLTHHANELNYLLTPAALPQENEGLNWQMQIKLAKDWQQGRRDLNSLQSQLLRASNTARYPFAYLLWKLLEREEKEAMGGSSISSWRTIWDTFLREEMARGLAATYQTCLSLRFLLCGQDKEQLEALAEEFTQSLALHNEQQVQALLAITNIYLRYLRYQRYQRYIKSLRDTQDLQVLLDKRGLLHMRDLRELRDLRDFRYLRELRDTQDLRDLIDLSDLQYLRNLRFLRDLRYLKYMLGLRDWLALASLPYLLELRELYHWLDPVRIIGILCDELTHPLCVRASVVLFALYSVITDYDSVPQMVRELVYNTLQTFQANPPQPLTIKEHLLIEVISQRIGVVTASTIAPPLSVTGPSNPNTRATDLYALRKAGYLQQSDVEGILVACTDTRKLSQAIGQEVDANTVQEVAWELLAQQFDLEIEAQAVAVQTLKDRNALVCAAAAQLLQRCKTLSPSVQREAAQKVIEILADEELSRRSFEPPDNRTWRLDDVLFETLRVLAE